MIPLLDVPTAVQILKNGGVVAYPTETFYGLGCKATQAETVKKIFEVKGRDFQSPLSVLIPSSGNLLDYVQDVSLLAHKLIKKYWPGPLTLIFKAKEGVFPTELLAGTDTIALRLSSHPVAQELARGLGLPLTTTSANKSGQPPARSAEEVREYFSDIDGVVHGGVLPPAQGSTILDVTVDPPRIIREGEISREELSQVLSINL